MGKYCLKLSEFEGNIRQSFEELRNENKLCDVTLATDDGHQIQAHRVILSAGSTFFKEVFSKCSQQNLCLYLKGIFTDDLESIIDFLYKGETTILQEHLNSFLHTAQELKVTGILNGDENVSETVQSDVTEESIEVLESFQEKQEDLPPTSLDMNQAWNTENTLKTETEHILSVEEEQNIQNFNFDLDARLNELIEKCLDLWKCRKCGKIKDHAENVVKLRTTQKRT